MVDAGLPRVLTDRVRVVLAPNPGPMTGPGTNTYLVGDDELLVIDPGPDDPRHLDALVKAGDDRIRWIAVTHAHADHSPGAAPLRDRLGRGVRVLGFGPRHGFEPDEVVVDGQAIGPPGLRLRAIHTPGHSSDHLCYFLEEERLLFAGDHVMNGSTVVIAPPDGDMAAYLTSLSRLRDLGPAAIAPGHGDLIADAADKIEEYLDHRLMREKAVVAAVRSAGPASLDQLVATVYADVNPALYPMARLSLWAHLRKLLEEGVVATADADDRDSSWELAARSCALQETRE